MDKNSQKYAGIVVENSGKFYLRNSKGVLYNVAQTEEIKRLFENRSVCVFEVRDDIKSKGSIAFATITSVSGRNGDPIPEGRAIAESYGLIRTPNPKVMEEVANIPQVITADMIKGIADLRDVPFITIDPNSAKDFDDAVFACKNDDGTYILRIAIANVAEFIKKDSELFKWAMDAGNSSYLGDTCNPMLPEELSNGICSLNEGEDRLVMCTTCTLDNQGKLINYTIEPAVINSRRRLTYKEADYLHFGENAKGDTKDHSGLEKELSHVIPTLGDLYDVAKILYRARMIRGAFDINSKKLSFKLDKTGTDVIGYEIDHSEAFTSVIEETAILKNEIWGEVAEKFGLPFYFRDHNQIEPGKVATLRGQLKPYGLKVPRPATSKALQGIINQVKGKRIEDYVVGAILKSMQPAFYDTENIGHAGLAIFPANFKSNRQAINQKSGNRSALIDSARSLYFKKTGRSNGFAFEGDITHSAYAQSSSPIRRGSDLGNQMQMFEFITTGEILFKRKEMQKHVDTLNFCESNASKAEAAYNDMLAAKWAMKNIGKTFRDCTIADIQESFAVVVTKDGFRMMLHLNSLGDRRRYLKIGAILESVTISKVTLYPASILCIASPSLKHEETKELEL